MEHAAAGFLRRFADCAFAGCWINLSLARKNQHQTEHMKMSTTIQRMLWVMIAVLCIAASSSAQQAAAPRAVVPFTTYAFGDIYIGETISQIFVIRNEGDADLLIKDFIGACGCEVLGVDRVIAPGKEGSARIEVSTVSQSSGELFKIATLYTNDPQRPTIRFALTANILTSGNGGPVVGIDLRAGKHIGPVFVGPDTRTGLVFAPGKTGRAEFTITVERGPLNVQRIESASQAISIRLETIAPGKQYKVIVENSSAEAEASSQEQLRVVTDHPALPSFPLFVRLMVRRN
jgi:hypothetical protein